MPPRDVPAAGPVSAELQMLAGLEELPCPDGIFGDRVRHLCRRTLVRADLLCIFSLLHKQDPHLQEAGLELAAGVRRDLPAHAGELEGPLCALLASGPLDSWVLRALVHLLVRFQEPGQPRFPAVYRALVDVLDNLPRPIWDRDPARPAPLPPRPVMPSRRFIMRNMYIDPRQEILGLLSTQVALGSADELAPLLRDALERHPLPRGPLG